MSIANTYFVRQDFLSYELFIVLHVFVFNYCLCVHTYNERYKKTHLENNKSPVEYVLYYASVIYIHVHFRLMYKQYMSNSTWKFIAALF